MILYTLTVIGTLIIILSIRNGELVLNIHLIQKLERLFALQFCLIVITIVINIKRLPVTD